MTNKAGAKNRNQATSDPKKARTNGLIIACVCALSFAGGAFALDEGAVPEVDQQTILRTTPTPFGAASSKTGTMQQQAAEGSVINLKDATLSAPMSRALPLGKSSEGMAPISISGGNSGLGIPRRSSRLSLQDRLVPSRLYLPGRMVLGKLAEFTIKGKPGSSVAIAMADRNSGAKPINGVPIRLGPDRKVVAIGKIPDNGVLTLTVETPIQGDLIGQFLYFEAALWTKDDMSDTQIASTVTSETEGAAGNGVVIAQEVTHKRGIHGIHIVPDAAIPLTQRSGLGINSSP